MLKIIVTLSEPWYYIRNDFHTNYVKNEEKCKFLKGDFRSFAAIYGTFHSNIGV